MLRWLFQSAFHRGSGCYTGWLLNITTPGDFQSAFHRGSGCYKVVPWGLADDQFFQSAFHRGSGCYKVVPWGLADDQFFQSAFHRGSGCYRNSNRNRRIEYETFSPLFIAAVVVTQQPMRHVVISNLSVRFSSRQWLLRVKDGVVYLSVTFQSAFHRGSGCYEIIITIHEQVKGFQSAFHRGSGCYSDRPTSTTTDRDFQSAFHRGSGCYAVLGECV